MNGNYEWQKFSAKDRTKNYRQQAQQNRQLKAGKTPNQRSGLPIGKAGFALLIGTALIVIGFFLSGCQANEVQDVSASAPASSDVKQGPSMQDRHRFHDQLWADAESRRVNLSSNSSAKGWSMADRIRFQDERAAFFEMRSAEVGAVRAEPTLSMKERHLFHDRLQK